MLVFELQNGVFSAFRCSYPVEGQNLSDFRLRSGKLPTFIDTIYVTRLFLDI